MKVLHIENLWLEVDAYGDDASLEAAEVLKRVNLLVEKLGGGPLVFPAIPDVYGAWYVEVPDKEATSKQFKVVAVSRNRNIFGLRRMVVVAPNGEAYQVLSNDVNIKREGDVLSVEQLDGRWNFSALGYEVPEKLPNAPPDVVKAVWRKEANDDAKEHNPRPADHP